MPWGGLPPLTLRKLAWRRFASAIQSASPRRPGQWQGPALARPSPWDGRCTSWWRYSVAPRSRSGRRGPLGQWPLSPERSWRSRERIRSNSRVGSTAANDAGSLCSTLDPGTHHYLCAYRDNLFRCCSMNLIKCFRCQGGLHLWSAVKSLARKRVNMRAIATYTFLRCSCITHQWQVWIHDMYNTIHITQHMHIASMHVHVQLQLQTSQHICMHTLYISAYTET